MNSLYRFTKMPFHFVDYSRLPKFLGYFCMVKSHFPKLYLRLPIVLFVCITSVLYGQKDGMERIDSLLKMLPQATSDSSRAIILDDLSFSYQSFDTEKGLAYGAQGLALSLKTGFKRGEAYAYNSIATNYWVKHDYATEEKYLLQALPISESIGDKKSASHTIRRIGDIYESQYNYSKALAYYQKAYSIAKEINDFGDIIKFQAYIANVYDLQKNYDQALVYYEKSIALLKEPSWSIIRAGYLRRAGLVISEKGDYKKALEYEKLAFKIYQSSTDSNHLAWTIRDLGTVYFQQGDYQHSLIYFQQAYDIFIVLPGFVAKNNAGICLAKMGKTYLNMAVEVSKQKEIYQKALRYANDTLTRAINLLKPRDWATLTDALQDLSTVNQLLGNYEAALNAFKEYAVYKDSLYNTEIEKKVIIHEMEFENNRQKDSITHANTLQVEQLKFLMQQKELSSLRSRQQTIYIVIVFIAICLIAFYFLYRNYLAKIALKNELLKERVEKKLEQAEHERNISRTTLTALISQMNPHFLFNALNTIQSFIYTNDKKNASSYLGKFSELTRKILDNSSKKAVSLDEEIALLQLYLDIEKVRFGNNFVATIETDIDLDTEAIFFPPMLVQPYVENAIKHGLLHRQDKKEIAVNIKKLTTGNNIEIVIDDNGIGRERSMQINKQKIGHHSFANTANEKRINLINQGLDKKITFDIIDKKNEKGLATGTKITLIIPIMTENLS